MAEARPWVRESLPQHGCILVRRVVVVLTDGYTPWPSQPSEGTFVVVGVIGGANNPTPPGWARTVRIELSSQSGRRNP